jgi:hypothetical protein
LAFTISYLLSPNLYLVVLLVLAAVCGILMVCAEEFRRASEREDNGDEVAGGIEERYDNITSLSSAEEGGRTSGGANTSRNRSQWRCLRIGSLKSFYYHVINIIWYLDIMYNNITSQMIENMLFSRFFSIVALSL